MPTFMQVVERLRERGQAPVSGPVSIQNLTQQLQPTPRRSVRALMAKALEGATRRSWAIILCRYKGEMANPALEQPVEQFYRPALVIDRRAVQASRQPVALMGKVFCKADADFGAIAAGDLLTTSSTRGHAMKALDRGRAFGAVIGKALWFTGRGARPDPRARRTEVVWI